MSLSASKFAHNEGHCVLRYSHDGGKVFTCGSEGDVRVHDGLDSDETASFEVGDEVLGLAVAANGKFYAAPINTNKVKVHNCEDGADEGVVANFTADATCIDVSADGTTLVAGSSDMTVKIVDTESLKSSLLSGHKAPVLSVALDPKKAFAVSSSCDGSTKLWRVDGSACLRTWSKCWPASNDTVNATTNAGLDWDPSGSGRFAVAFAAAIRLLSADSADGEESLTAGDGTDTFSTVAFSPTGKKVAGATTKGKILVWTVEGGRLAAEFQVEGHPRICSMQWNPKDNGELAFVDTKGHWATVIGLDKSVSGAKPDTTKPVDENEMNPDELAAALFDDDDDNENSFSIHRIKKETGFLNDEDSNMTGKGVDDDDDKASVVTKATDQGPPEGQQQHPLAPAPVGLDVDIQEPFQPGSTPQHLEQRFMVWNSVGIVKCYNGEDESSIDVEFHDTAVHHQIHLGNSNNYTMADLSTEAIVLASEADEAAAVPSKLTCHYFASTDVNKEWSIDMPDKEDIYAVCCGLGWIAAATDRRHLRFFSVAGFQKEVLSLPGPVVAMAGCGDFVAVAAHLGMPLPGDQFIGVAVFNVRNGAAHKCPEFHPLPLAPRSCLSWLGFTDEGTPCTMDSAGFIRTMIGRFGPGSWIEVCNTKALAKGKSDHYFMVGASEAEFKARCILVKGSRYPATLPKPVISVLQLRVPLCGAEEGERASSEQAYWRARIISASAPDSDKHETEALMKLFALACQADQHARALDICQLMSPECMQLAIRYASRAKRMQLASRVSALACEKQEELEKQRELEEDQVSQDFFASQEDIDMECDGNAEAVKNPFLAAQAKKAAGGSVGVLANPNERNPFARKTGISHSPSIRSGIVFDDMAKKDVTRSGGRKNSFGSFGSKTIEQNKSPFQNNSRQVVLTKKVEKENKTDNFMATPTQDGEKKLKGFLLWFEEVKDQMSDELDITDPDRLRMECLSKWKAMSKSEKEGFTTERLPKRKREHGSEDGGSSSKLAKFVAPVE